MTPPGTHPSPLVWAQHAGRELGPVARWRLRRHFGRCPSCRARDLAMREERARFEQSPDRQEQLERLLARARSAGARSVLARPLPWLVIGGFAAAALALVLVVRVPSGEPDSRFLAKGDEAFALYVQRPGGAVRLGDTCRAGDRLTARLKTDHPYLLLLERDGAGAVQELFRTSDGGLPASWVLDEVPGEECFAAFFSDAPLDANEARRSVTANAHAPVLPNATVRVRCCRKPSP